MVTQLLLHDNIKGVQHVVEPVGRLLLSANRQGAKANAKHSGGDSSLRTNFKLISFATYNNNGNIGIRFQFFSEF